MRLRCVFLVARGPGHLVGIVRKRRPFVCKSAGPRAGMWRFFQQRGVFNYFIGLLACASSFVCTSDVGVEQAVEPRGVQLVSARVAGPHRARNLQAACWRPSQPPLPRRPGSRLRCGTHAHCSAMVASRNVVVVSRSTDTSFDNLAIALGFLRVRSARLLARM